MSSRTRGLSSLALVVVLTLVGACSAASNNDQTTPSHGAKGAPNSHDPQGARNSQGSETASARPGFVVVVTGDALDTHGLDYMTARGAREARATGASGHLIVTHLGDPSAALEQAASSHPRIVLGFFYDPATLLDLARNHPDTDFVSLDDTLPAPPPNVTGTHINAHESSYLAGVAAATMSRTHRVGAVLGSHKPAVDQFFYGYKQGVLATCRHCRILTEDLDNQFTNTAAAADAAKRLYRRGADIVFAVAGPASIGVLQQANRQHRYAIGVDGIQDNLFPGTVITSVVKRVDVLVTRMIKAQRHGNFPGGTTNDAGLAAGLAAGLSDLSWDLGSTTFARHAPDNMQASLRLAQARVATARTAILTGRLHICDALNNPTAPICSTLGLQAH